MFEAYPCVRMDIFCQHDPWYGMYHTYPWSRLISVFRISDLGPDTKISCVNQLSEIKKILKQSQYWISCSHKHPEFFYKKKNLNAVFVPTISCSSQPPEINKITSRLLQRALRDRENLNPDARISCPDKPPSVKKILTPTNPKKLVTPTSSQKSEKPRNSLQKTK